MCPVLCILKWFLFLVAIPIHAAKGKLQKIIYVYLKTKSSALPKMRL